MDIDKEVYQTIDWPLALKLANNDSDWAKQMLILLATELPEIKDQLEQASTQLNYEQAARLIHKLHGACSYCGVPKLRNIVSRFKEQTQPEKPETLREYTPQLVNEIDAIVAAVKMDNFTQS